MKDTEKIDVRFQGGECRDAMEGSCNRRIWDGDGKKGGQLPGS